MTPSPTLATYVVPRVRTAAVGTERRYPARVLEVDGDRLSIEYIADDGRIRRCAAPCEWVEVHP